jgi:predicted hotdog family 3-hydroxylacyl-ACP dehydratase
MRDSPQTLDRAGILERIPHQGVSCLLDRLCRWNEYLIVCETRSHLLADNPYRLNGRLSTVCAVEYATQAFALHAWLNSSEPEAKPRPGYLAAVRELQLSVARLDICSGPLIVIAEVLASESRMLLYAFSVQHQNTAIAQGRAAVAFPATLQ